MPLKDTGGVFSWQHLALVGTTVASILFILNYTNAPKHRS